ncbi:hypothetical protein C8R45DRAFT_937140 [Mycena sanguinolenta]|nr:hypothetical protein C8R45DRAFT_937140 [Mycena sanguinolenta]
MTDCKIIRTLLLQVLVDQQEPLKLTSRIRADLLVVLVKDLGFDGKRQITSYQQWDKESRKRRGLGLEDGRRYLHGGPQSSTSTPSLIPTADARRARILEDGERPIRKAGAAKGEQRGWGTGVNRAIRAVRCERDDGCSAASSVRSENATTEEDVGGERAHRAALTSAPRSSSLSTHVSLTPRRDRLRVLAFANNIQKGVSHQRMNLRELGQRD